MEIMFMNCTSLMVHIYSEYRMMQPTNVCKVMMDIQVAGIKTERLIKILDSSFADHKLIVSYPNNPTISSQHSFSIFDKTFNLCVNLDNFETDIKVYLLHILNELIMNR